MMASTELVLVLFPYEYKTKEGRCITIQPDDCYILVSRTNAHWWHVCKDHNTKPFYIPARYVRVLDPDPSAGPVPTSAADRDAASYTSKDEKLAAATEPDPNQKEDEEPEGLYETTIEVPAMTLSPGPTNNGLDSSQYREKEEGEGEAVEVDQNGELSPGHTQAEDEGDSSDLSKFFPAGPPLPFQDPGDCVYEDLVETRPSPPAEAKMVPGQEQDSESAKIWDLMEDGVYESIEELGSDWNNQGRGQACGTPAEPRWETPVIATAVVSEKASSPMLAVESGLPHAEADKVEEDDSPVYVNLPPFSRKPTDPPFDSSEPPNSLPSLRAPSPPSSSSLSQSPDDLGRDIPFSAVIPDSGGWEVHVDEDSGQEFYYHPASGHTTWDRPAVLAMDPAVGVQEPPVARQRSSRSSSSTPPSPSIPTSSPTGPASNHPLLSVSPSNHTLTSALPSSSPPRWRASDWERIVDEATGQPYFYNQASGETSWDPPEELQGISHGRGHGHTHTSPKTQHRDDGPPPLPAEDYPAEDEYTLCADDEDSAASHPPDIPAPMPLPSLPSVSEYSLALPSMPSGSEYSLGHFKRSVIPRASLDRSTPAGWSLHIDPEGTWVFTSNHTHEQWIKSLDDRGQTYYYLRDGSRSQWNLPELSPSHSRVGNGGTDTDGSSVLRNWRQSVVPSQEEKFQPSHRRNFSDYGSDISSSPEMHSQADLKQEKSQANDSTDSLPHVLPSLEKAGILNKTKVSENGKKVRKNWAQSWTVLHGGVLTFHKDPKSAPGSTSTKSNHILTELTVDLRGATIGWAGKEKSSKKNVLELKSQNGSEYLIQYDTESIINDWHKVIHDTIRQLEQEQQQHHSEEEEDVYEKVPGVDDRPLSGQEKKRVGSKQSFTTSTPSTTSSTSEADQKKVRTKLRKFLLKRPTLQSVKEKGYIRENVFGCHLANLCAQEKTTVPTFVEKCIRTVESRGLGIDGIYRVSGNLATIQKLRFKADHEDIDFEEGHWDIHVITGALKLFFRELQEPLFPYSHFNNFIAGIKIPDYHDKVSYMSELVKSLPPANHDTMEILFRHLRKVIEHGEENRMSVQNVAIVFGPTLLKPEVESANITMFMVFQNQIVEFILNEFDNMFYSQ